MTLSPLTQYALVAFLVLLPLSFLVRRFRPMSDAGTDYRFYTGRMTKAAVLFVAAGAVLAVALAIADVERWERATLLYAIVGGVSLFVMRVLEQRSAC